MKHLAVTALYIYCPNPDADTCLAEAVMSDGRLFSHGGFDSVEAVTYLAKILQRAYGRGFSMPMPQDGPAPEV